MISLEDVRTLAGLARLRLSPQEEEALQKDISSILDYVGQVSSVPMPERKEDAGAWRNVMREDAPRGEEDPLAGKEEALRAAFPSREGDFNVVRKIIQKDE
jgi:aspartyl-tRNA(Asn)/glutamyl-tRNA(Gln) amidotransferase subunit C